MRSALADEGTDADNHHLSSIAPRRKGFLMPPADLLSDLTPIQAEAVQHTDGPLLILAGAGSGKTRVITRRVAYLLSLGVRPGQILAITFTNKAANEMRQRVDALVPGNRVWISTFHAMGAKLLRQYGERLGLDKNFTIYDVDDRNKLVKQAMDAAGLDDPKFSPDRIAGAISKAKNALLTPKKYAAQASDFFSQTVASVYGGYERKLRAANGMDFDDLLYIPALALRSNEEFRAELDRRFKYVMIDEYQDTNSAQYQIAIQLTKDERNLCVVGDSDQCVLPGTMIDTPDGKRAVETIVEGQQVSSATGWGKVGSRAVEKVMVSQFKGEVVRIKVEGGHVIRATPNHVCFARLEARADTHYVYLMFKKGVGYRVGTTRGVRASKSGVLMSGLQVRTNQEVADAIWVVRTCQSSAEARYWEQYISVKYGLPTMVFFVRGRRMEITQDLIDQLYRCLDTEASAKRLMADFHIDRRYPHHRPAAVVRGGLARRHVHFTVFGDPRSRATKKTHEHRIQLITSGSELRRKMDTAGHRTRAGNKGTWRIETSRAAYDDGADLAAALSRLDDFEVIPRARLTPEKAFAFMPAGQIHPGMIVPVSRKGVVENQTVISVEWEEYEGLVYDLSIPDTRNFIAGGVVVHNSIYKWRGSDIRNILDFERDFPDAKVITLEKNYRSTKSIIRAASNLIDQNKQRKKKTLVTDNPEGEPVKILVYDSGSDEADFIVKRIRAMVKEGKYRYRDFAIFLRINALTRSLESAFINNAVPFQIVKGLAFFDRKENKDIMAYLRLLVNPADTVSFMRAVNEPPRGIGKTTLEHLQRYADSNEISLSSAAEQVKSIPQIKGKAVVGLRDFSETMKLLRKSIELPADQLIREVLDKTGYRDMLKHSGDDEDQERLANIEELITAASQFVNDEGSRLISDFLEQVTLASDVDGWDEKSDNVSVMTLHAAKGLEFPVVFMMAVEQGLLPHERSLSKEDELEEERRLAFVGMTRAMKELFMCHSRLREFRGQVLYAIPSMFLDELPDDVQRLDQSRHAGRDAGDGHRAGGNAAVSAWKELGHNAKPRAAPIPPSPATPAKNDTPFRLKMTVEHDKYGQGVVEDVSGFGAMTKVKVRFRTSGVITFIAAQARLKVVSGGTAP